MKLESSIRTYRQDREWADKFIPRMIQIIGPHLLCPAPFERDTLEATDLIVLTAKDMTIACRVRQNKYLAQYGNQFTIRSKRESKSETELSKITQGWGDWMFYGFAHPDKIELVRWMIVDLSAFRAQMIWRTVTKYGRKDNGDGTHFYWFDINGFAPTPPILIASSDSNFYLTRQLA